MFCDNDLDNALDAGESGDAGAVVYLYSGSTYIDKRTTDANGNYSFTPPPGTYTVKFVTAASGHVIEASHSTVVVSQSFGPFTVNSGGSSANINFAEVDQGSIGGTVYLDVNDSGVQGDTTGETGISNVTVTLTGTDYLGAPVSRTTTTNSSGVYSFTGLLPSNSTGYTIKETQPAGYLDGNESVGKINGQTVGASVGADSITCIVLPGCNNDGTGYNFGEHGVFHGLTATIGFWHNNNGQALIKSFGNTSSGLSLGNWLAINAPNLFGKNAPAFNVNSTIGTNLTGRSNTDVANYFLSLFGASGQKSYGQVLATAFAVFTTTNSLNTGATSRSLATKYGFTLSNTGTGAASYAVPSADWPAFGLTSANSTQSIASLLLLANKYAIKGVLNNGNTTLITETNDVFNGINNKGDIGAGMTLVTAGTSADPSACAGPCLCRLLPAVRGRTRGRERRSGTYPHIGCGRSPEFNAWSIWRRDHLAAFGHHSYA